MDDLEGFQSATVPLRVRYSVVQYVAHGGLSGSIRT